MLELYIDSFKMDTSLAEQYLRTINSEIHSLGVEDFEDGKIGHDCCENKIHFVDYEKVTSEHEHFRTHDEPNLHEMCNNLIRKIKENTDLFAQLEYSLRKVPADVTKSAELTLILQNLMYWNAQRAQGDLVLTLRYVVMNENTPLSSLGSLAPALCNKYRCIIESTKETAAICHLFVQLCRQVGLEHMHLYLIQNPEFVTNHRHNRFIDLTKMEGMRNGCAGVVTGRADIDSAVDTFLYCTCRFPWNIQRILVQESVYNSFRKATFWKTNLKKSETGLYQSMLALYEQKCTDVFINGEKVLLLDFTGTAYDVKQSSHNVILIEAYRTSKELISLLKQYKPFCLSLWSNDVSESNEIAFEIDTSIVWINGINNFDGPPRSSQAFYSKIYSHTTIDVKMVPEEYENLKKLQISWQKLDMKDRREKIYNAIRNTDNVDNSEFIRELLRQVYDYSNKFVEIGDGAICIGIDELVGIVCVEVEIDEIILLLKSLIVGNVVMVPYVLSSDVYNFIDNLKKNDLPIKLTCRLEYDYPIIKTSSTMYNTRIVRSTFGTKFSN